MATDYNEVHEERPWLTQLGQYIPHPYESCIKPDCDRCAAYEAGYMVAIAEQIVGGGSLDADSAPTPQ